MWHVVIMRLWGLQSGCCAFQHHIQIIFVIGFYACITSLNTDHLDLCYFFISCIDKFTLARLWCMYSVYFLFLPSLEEKIRKVVLWCVQISMLMSLLALACIKWNSFMVDLDLKKMNTIYYLLGYFLGNPFLFLFFLLVIERLFPFYVGLYCLLNKSGWMILYFDYRSLTCWVIVLDILKNGMIHVFTWILWLFSI